MNIRIIENINEFFEIIIKCPKADASVMKLKKHIEAFEEKLDAMFKLAGYDVKYIQEYLNLSCPQPIYRWFKGQNLPTVEKLYALSILLGVHMEELLVLQGQPVNIGLYKVAQEPKDKRLLYYVQRLQRAA